MASNQGIQSNKLVRPGVRTGAAAGGKNPGYAGQLGESQGNKVMNHVGTVRGGVEPMQAATPYSCALGNELATNVGKGGPGAGRTTMRSGSQGVHGAPTAAVAKPTMPMDVHGFAGPEIGGSRRG